MSFFSPFVLVLAVRARTLKKTSVDRLGFSGIDHARYVKYLYRIRSLSRTQISY